MDDEVDVIARNGLIARFKVPNGKRPEIEKAIEDKLRSGTVDWKADDYGVTVACVHKDNVWKPRRRFRQNDEGKE
jgi:hypothetical protein